MDKPELDMLYHNLRRLCITDDIPQKEAVAGLVSHLTKADGDYPGLLRFLGYYGEEYILPKVLEHMAFVSHSLEFTRVVELGAGFGWLGRGISRAYDLIPTLFIDKRQYTLIDIVADIESKNGAKRVLDELQSGDLIVMSELLHCLDNPRKVLAPFTKWPMVVVEYMPDYSPFRTSYSEQIEKFGAKPIASIREVFPSGSIVTESTNTHVIWIIMPLK